MILKPILDGLASWADPEKGQGSGPPPPPLKIHKKYIGFLSSTGPDPLNNYKATKPSFNVGPSSDASETPFKLRFAGGPMIKWRFAGVPMMAHSPLIN